MDWDGAAGSKSNDGRRTIPIKQGRGTTGQPKAAISLLIEIGYMHRRSGRLDSVELGS